MPRRNREFKSNVARRAIVVGTIPLVLAVACSNTSDQPAKVADGTSTQSAAPKPNDTRTPGNPTAPQSNPQPGLADSTPGDALPT
ncbi:hypothetical protein, partial [Nocardia sp. JMUB6875]|uniref:hypothetical protein n=1 Tax=Nocardia sp. JMUB6875 TaxID=3158170 RepID=UPI0034E8F953